MVKDDWLAMESYVLQNKKAWEYDSYNFWVSKQGHPDDVAKQVRENPKAGLRFFGKYFTHVSGTKIANICGSCGARAVPLAVMGANVTVFDISESNRKYACETAEAAGVQLKYVVGDILDVDLDIYGNHFDIVFMEGGILHYFHDINKFIFILHSLLKPEGKLILSDFHPFNKIMDAHGFGGLPDEPDYFSVEIEEAEMAHARFYDDEKRGLMPKCLLRKYTLSEIINTLILNNFNIKSFEEHPSWANCKLPGEFTIFANK